MLVLALDTASHYCSAALAADGRILAQVEENIGAGHAEYLALLLPALLDEAGKNFSDIDRIGVNIGPGSFTGVRVGVAAARALALGLEKPAFGISAFAALYRQAQLLLPKNNTIAVFVALAAAQGRFYTQYFPAAGAARPPQNLTEAEAAAFITAQSEQTASLCLTGSAAAALSRQLPEAQARQLIILGPAEAETETPFIPIAVFAALTAAQSEAQKAPPVPLYMRAPDAKPQTESYLSKGKSQFRAAPKDTKPAEQR